MTGSGRSWLRRWALRVAGAVALLYLGLCVTAWFVQHDVIFPLSVEESIDRGVPPGANLLWVAIENGERVEGWFFPGDGCTAEQPGPALIFFHGNAQVLDHVLEYAELYVPWGISVLLVEYRGYGRSGGRPSEAALARDMDAFHAQLIARPEVDPSRLIYHGRSLGSAVAVDLAGRHPPAGLILESAFTSLRDMFQRYGIPGFLVRHPFDNLAVLRDFQGPVLLIHGTDDDIVPVSQARRLAEAAADARLVEIDALHELPPDWNAHVAILRQFLHDRLGVSAVPGP